MKSRNVLALSISLILSAPVLAQQSQPVFMPAANLKWTDLDPKGAPGVQIVDLWATMPRERSARSSSFRRDSPLPFTRTPTP